VWKTTLSWANIPIYILYEYVVIFEKKVYRRILGPVYDSEKKN